MRRGKEWGILFTECGFILQTADLIEKSTSALEYRSKGQFCKNTVYLERGMPYFAFVDTNAVLVRKIDKP